MEAPAEPTCSRASASTMRATHPQPCASSIAFQQLSAFRCNRSGRLRRPCGLMDKALVFGTKDCWFESCQGHFCVAHGGGGVRASQQLVAVRPCLSRARCLWRRVVRAGSCAVTRPNAALQRGGSRNVRAEVASGTMRACQRNFASVLRSSACSLACRMLFAHGALGCA